MPSKKPKIAKNLSSKKTFAISIPAAAISAFQFLQVKKQNQVFAITNFKYTLHFIFWEKNKIFATG